MQNKREPLQRPGIFIRESKSWPNTGSAGSPRPKFSYSLPGKSEQKKKIQIQTKIFPPVQARKNTRRFGKRYRMLEKNKENTIEKTERLVSDFNLWQMTGMAKVLVVMNLPTYSRKGREAQKKKTPGASSCIRHIKIKGMKLKTMLLGQFLKFFFLKMAIQFLWPKLLISSINFFS